MHQPACTTKASACHYIPVSEMILTHVDVCWTLHQSEGQYCCTLYRIMLNASLFSVFSIVIYFAEIIKMAKIK